MVSENEPIGVVYEDLSFDEASSFLYFNVAAVALNQIFPGLLWQRLQANRSVICLVSTFLEAKWLNGVVSDRI